MPITERSFSIAPLAKTLSIYTRSISRITPATRADCLLIFESFKGSFMRILYFASIKDDKFMISKSVLSSMYFPNSLCRRNIPEYSPRAPSFKPLMLSFVPDGSTVFPKFLIPSESVSEPAIRASVADINSSRRLSAFCTWSFMCVSLTEVLSNFSFKSLSFKSFKVQFLPSLKLYEYMIFEPEEIF